MPPSSRRGAQDADQMGFKEISGSPEGLAGPRNLASETPGSRGVLPLCAGESRQTRSKMCRRASNVGAGERPTVEQYAFYSVCSGNRWAEDSLSGTCGGLSARLRDEHDDAVARPHIVEQEISIRVKRFATKHRRNRVEVTIDLCSCGRSREGGNVTNGQPILPNSSAP